MGKYRITKSLLSLFEVIHLNICDGQNVQQKHIEIQINILFKIYMVACNDKTKDQKV